MESRIYDFDTIQAENNLDNIEIFEAEENERIKEDIMEMNKIELKMASSIMSKWLFLRKVQVQRDFTPDNNQVEIKS